MATIRKRTWTTSSGEIRTAFSVNIEGEGNRQRRQFATRREAEAYRLEIEGQVKGGIFRPDGGRITVAETADRFLTYCQGRMQRRERMSRQNYKVYEGHVHNYICPDPVRHAGRKLPPRMTPFAHGIGGVRLAQLTPRRVAEFRDRLREAGVSVITARKILGTLQQLLAYAISQDLIGINAARGVKVIGRRDEGAKKIVPPTKEAMRRLIEVAAEDFRTQLMFASATGVRAGELHALRWRHLDLEKAEVKIEMRVDAYGEGDVTKTTAGMRTIPLGAPIVAALKEWKLAARRKEPDDLVFPNRRGWYTSHDNMVKRKFLPLFDRLAKLHAEDRASTRSHPRASTGMRCGISRSRAGSRRGSARRPCRPSPGTAPCRSRWTVTGTCSNRRTTSARWTLSPRI